MRSELGKGLALKVLDIGKAPTIYNFAIIPINADIKYDENPI